MDAHDGDTSGLLAAWPPFGIRIRTERLTLRLPAEHEIPAFIELGRAGIHPSDEMPFGIAWTRAPSPAYEQGFLRHHWGARAAWRPDEWELHLGVWRGDEPIGAQSVMAKRFAIHRTVETGSWLGQTSQGQGFGKEMRGAVLAFAFDGLGALVAETEAFLDNDRSSGVSRSLGYEPNGRGRLAPEGVSRETQRFVMTLDGWRSRARPPVAIEGLEGCLGLFGADGPRA
jgi:RimJ/RimL family protein N-acetyltransferase